LKNAVQAEGKKEEGRTDLVEEQKINDAVFFFFFNLTRAIS
jgi:hypothetical protein